MNEPHHTTLEQVKDHRFVIMIFGSIAIALVLVAVALGLYVSSGAYQLDLSRPGDVRLREQVQEDKTFRGFASSGPLDKEAVDSFETMYNEKLADIEATSLYNSRLLSPEGLGIDNSSAKKKTDD
jgi:hypothetical protein